MFELFVSHMSRTGSIKGMVDLDYLENEIYKLVREDLELMKKLNMEDNVKKVKLDRSLLFEMIEFIYTNHQVFYK